MTAQRKETKKELKEQIVKDAVESLNFYYMYTILTYMTHYLLTEQEATEMVLRELKHVQKLDDCLTDVNIIVTKKIRQAFFDQKDTIKIQKIDTLDDFATEEICTHFFEQRLRFWEKCLPIKNRYTESHLLAIKDVRQLTRNPYYNEYNLLEVGYYFMGVLDVKTKREFLDLKLNDLNQMNFILGKDSH